MPANLRIYSATITDLFLTGTSAAVASAAFSVESAAVGTTQHGDYPLAELELGVTFTVAPTADKTIDVYVREQNIAAGTKSPAPSTTYKNRYLGAFKPDAITTAQILKVDGIPLVKDGTYYFHNNATGQSMPAGWFAKLRPYSYG